VFFSSAAEMQCNELCLQNCKHAGTSQLLLYCAGFCAQNDPRKSLCKLADTAGILSSCSQIAFLNTQSVASEQPPYLEMKPTPVKVQKQSQIGCLMPCVQELLSHMYIPWKLASAWNWNMFILSALGGFEAQS